MASNLVIVESPAKEKTIEKFLGKDFKVLASFGHIRDLPSKNGSVDVDNDFEMHYAVSKGSEKNIKAIVDAAKKADCVYLATDPDREGEAISWHVLEELKRRMKKDFERLDVKRIVFSEITKSAVQNAVANPRGMADNLVDAQQARRALDYLVGFNLSPVLWRKVKGGLSAGRVQSVALRLICEREDEIEAFTAQEYWSIAGNFTTPEGDTLPAKLALYNGDKVEKFSFTNEEQATGVVSTLSPLSYKVAEITKKQSQRRPAPPFITSTLQQEASRKLGFSAKRTMNAAQRLYEAGIITYMRTDSVNLSTEALNSTRAAIQHFYGDDYLPEKPNFYKSKQQNAQEAHEAIRPTNPEFTPKAAAAKLEADQAKLYSLVWKRTVACQMVNAKVDQTAIVIEADGGKHNFRATGSTIAFPGFLKVYEVSKSETDAKDDDEGNILPAVNEGAPLGVQEIVPNQHFTEPPARYSEASLVKALEENGIGRPSTYATIISTIQDRGYVRIDQRRFFPEDIGRIVSKFLVEHFAKWVDIGFTANLEEELDQISRGETPWKEVMREFWSPFKKQVDDRMENVRKSDVTTEGTGETCPTCGKGELLIRLGRYGRFKGCSNYPECTHIENMDGSTKADKPEAKDTGVQCPKCKKHNIVERKSRRGKIFYSCGGYPDCDYAIWDKPQVEPCPECKWPITTTKEMKSKGLVTKCPSCDWQDPPMSDAEKKRAAAAKERWEARKKAPAKKKTVAKKK